VKLFFAYCSGTDAGVGLS